MFWQFWGLRFGLRSFKNPRITNFRKNSKFFVFIISSQNAPVLTNSFIRWKPIRFLTMITVLKNSNGVRRIAKFVFSGLPFLANLWIPENMNFAVLRTPLGFFNNVMSWEVRAHNSWTYLLILYIHNAQTGYQWTINTMILSAGLVQMLLRNPKTQMRNS